MTTTAANFEQMRDALAARLMRSTSGMFDIYTTYLGCALGLYEGMSTAGACTSTELAHSTATCERYVREWLEQQTVTGTLVVDDPAAEPLERHYRLPPGHAEVLVDRENINYLAPLAQLMVGTVRPLSAIFEAFRSGRGVPFSDYGPDLRDGQAGLNRAAFLQLLGQRWIPAIPDVHARLHGKPPAHIADVGCGAGWASVGLALAYPLVRVDGFDLDPPSVALARANAVAMGVADRVHFTECDAGVAAPAQDFDLVFAFECIHDMANPVGILRAMGKLAGEHGVVIVVDERVGDSFAERNPETEWFMYGFSVLHCLPAAMVQQPSAATGTVMRPATLRGYALQSGFREIAVLPIENPMYAFYRLLR